MYVETYCNCVNYLDHFQASRLARIGGSESKAMTRAAYKRVVSAELGHKLNLTGYNDKGCVKGSALESMITSTSKHKIQKSFNMNCICCGCVCIRNLCHSGFQDTEHCNNALYTYFDTTISFHRGRSDGLPWRDGGNCQEPTEKSR